MFSKKMSKLILRIPVSIRVTVWFTAVIIFLFSIVLSSVILLEDRYINNTSTEELVSAVEKIYEDPDEFENFNDGIYYIKYNHSNYHQIYENENIDQFLIYNLVHFAIAVLNYFLSLKFFSLICQIFIFSINNVCYFFKFPKIIRIVFYYSYHSI